MIAVFMWLKIYICVESWQSPLLLLLFLSDVVVSVFVVQLDSDTIVSFSSFSSILALTISSGVVRYGGGGWQQWSLGWECCPNTLYDSHPCPNPHLIRHRQHCLRHVIHSFLILFVKGEKSSLKLNTHLLWLQGFPTLIFIIPNRALLITTYVLAYI